MLKSKEHKLRKGQKSNSSKVLSSLAHTTAPRGVAGPHLFSSAQKSLLKNLGKKSPKSHLRNPSGSSLKKLNEGKESDFGIRTDNSEFKGRFLPLNIFQRNV